jgi:hypothetical protein
MIWRDQDLNLHVSPYYSEATLLSIRALLESSRDLRPGPLLSSLAFNPLDFPAEHIDPGCHYKTWNAAHAFTITASFAPRLVLGKKVNMED